MTAALVPAAVAAAFFLLGRWGLRNAPELVSAGASPERRAKDERSLRRGARSCLVMAALFAALAALSAVSAVTDAHTPH